MLKQLLAMIGVGLAACAQAEQVQPQARSPYGDPALNAVYNLLFCDSLELFRAGGEKAGGPWAVLLAEDPRPEALRAIAEDAAQESRLRVLAYNRLREKEEAVPPGKLLGVIVEIALDEGLDVLAAFPDGRVRYINHAGGMSVFEASPPEVDTQVRRLLAASQPVVSQIGPWDQARLPPPSRGMVRMTFLVSDGLYFGEGPQKYMQADPMGGPVVAASLGLLQAVTAADQEARQAPPGSRLESTR